MPANVPYYQNQLRGLLDNPSSFSGTPGFGFALDTGLEAVNRSNSRMRGSGNALAALTKYGTGLAQQDYGNQVDRLGRLSGQEQQYDLGLGQNANTAVANTNTATRNANDYSLGQTQNANTRMGNDQQFGLGMYRAGNDFSLGQGQNANTAQNNWWNYDLGRTQNANTAANNQNTFNTNQGRNDIDWFNAGTNRASAASQDYYRGQDSQRAWQPLRKTGY